MNIIVTGSAGFIGKHLMEALASEHRVLGVDIKTGTDLTKPGDMDWILEKMPSADFIFNLAGTCSTARGFTHPEEAMQSNVRAVFNVMQLARKNGAKVIHTSSIKAQVGDDGMYTPYGLSKLMGEMIVKEWEKCYGVPAVVNRPGTIYGPGQHGSEESGWLAWFIKCAILGKEVTINGLGDQVRDPLYVTDYVKVLIHQMRYFNDRLAPDKDYYSVGGGVDNEVTVIQAVHYINTIVPLKCAFGPVRKGDNKILVSKTIEPQATSWQEGIKKTIEFYQQHKELL